MAKKGLSWKQSEFLKLLQQIHNNKHCSFKCAYPSILNRVVIDNEYNTIQRTALITMRNDYIKYVKQLKSNG